MKCPVCRAENDQGPQCRRCKADLALLFTLADQRRSALRTYLFSLAYLALLFLAMVVDARL